MVKRWCTLDVQFTFKLKMMVDADVWMDFITYLLHIFFVTFIFCSWFNGWLKVCSFQILMGRCFVWEVLASFIFIVFLFIYFYFLLFFSCILWKIWLLFILGIRYLYVCIAVSCYLIYLYFLDFYSDSWLKSFHIKPNCISTNVE